MSIGYDEELKPFQETIPNLNDSTRIGEFPNPVSNCLSNARAVADPGASSLDPIQFGYRL